MRRFLQRALKPLGHLLHRLFHRRAGPGGLDDHGLDDEGRILAAAQAVVGRKPRQHGDDHQVDRDRPVLQRPLGEIEAVHCCDPSKRTC